MRLKTIDISANGKLILSGEHSVLYGYSCISIAINKKINVSITQRSDKKIVINSKEFGDENFFLNEKNEIKNWCKSIYYLCNKLSKTGLDIVIKSSIPSGCGTSGALFSCIACCLFLLKNEKLTTKQLLNKTLKIYFEFNKKNNVKASGVDIITSILGGVVYYNPKKKNYKTSSIKFF